MTAELNARGCQCSVNAVAKLMRELGIEARRARPFKPRTTKVDLAARYSPNRLGSQQASRFGETLVSDWMLDTRATSFHLDRGTQCTSQKLRGQLESLGIRQSMSGKGNCYDNATCESFFSSLKRELMPDCGFFESRREARLAIFEHIEGFYNTRRRHSSLGNIPPVAFIKQHSELAKAA